MWNAYTEKILHLDVKALERCSSHAKPPFPYTKGTIKTLPSNSLIFPKNGNVLENSSATENLFKVTKITC